MKKNFLLKIFYCHEFTTNNITMFFGYFGFELTYDLIWISHLSGLSEGSCF